MPCHDYALLPQDVPSLCDFALLPRDVPSPCFIVMINHHSSPHSGNYKRHAPQRESHLHSTQLLTTWSNMHHANLYLSSRYLFATIHFTCRRTQMATPIDVWNLKLRPQRPIMHRIYLSYLITCSSHQTQLA